MDRIHALDAVTPCAARSAQRDQCREVGAERAPLPRFVEHRLVDLDRNGAESLQATEVVDAVHRDSFSRDDQCEVRRGTPAGTQWRVAAADGDAVGMEPLTTAELEAGLDAVPRAPTDFGRLELIVRRPAVDERETIQEGQLDTEVGLVGDTWRERPSSSTPDKSAHPEKQVMVMNARFASLVARRDDRRELSGDQLYLDLDISQSNLPPGTRLAIGPAVIEVTEPPHTGCAKFAQRFGVHALRLANSPLGLELRLRGMNAKVVTPGTVRTGDEVRKVAGESERENHYERPVDRFRRGAAGSVIAAGLLGLRDAMEGRPGTRRGHDRQRGAEPTARRQPRHHARSRPSGAFDRDRAPPCRAATDETEP